MYIYPDKEELFLIIGDITIDSKKFNRFSDLINVLVGEDEKNEDEKNEDEKKTVVIPKTCSSKTIDYIVKYCNDNGNEYEKYFDSVTSENELSNVMNYADYLGISSLLTYGTTYINKLLEYDINNIIEDYPKLPFNNHILCGRKDMSLKYIEKYIVNSNYIDDFPLDLYKNPIITPEFISKYQCFNMYNGYINTNTSTEYLKIHNRYYRFIDEPNLTPEYAEKIYGRIHGSFLKIHNISPELINKYINTDYEYNYIWTMLRNPTIEFCHIEKYLYKLGYDKHYDLNHKIYFPNLYHSNVYRYKYPLNIDDYEKIYRNPVDILAFIDKHSDKPWIWGTTGLSKYRSLTPEFIEKYIDKPWNFIDLSSCPNITEALVKKYIHKKWCMPTLIYNKNISPDFIINHTNPNKKLWKRILRSPNITLDILLKHMTNHISKKRKIKELNEDIMKKYLSKSLEWKSLGHLKDISEEFVEKYINQNWNWYELSKNKNISLKFIEKYPDKKWTIFANPNIFPEYALEYISKNKIILNSDVYIPHGIPYNISETILRDISLNTFPEFIKYKKREIYNKLGLDLNPNIVSMISNYHDDDDDV